MRSTVPDDKRKRIIAGVLGFFALLALYPLYQELFGGPTAAPPPPPIIVNSPTAKTVGPTKAVSTPPGFAVGQSAVKVGTSGAKLDPTLHMESMLVAEGLVYTGTGRNIFAGGNEEPMKIAVVKPLAPARQTVVVPPPPIASGPPPIPPPPPINLKFFGTATSQNGTRRAFLLNGDDVFLASAGDVVQRRYRVVSIAANSILIEDMPNSYKQTLPLVGP